MGQAVEREEIEKLKGEYDKDEFYILEDGSFYDPWGYKFDPEGYDEYGGYYDEFGYYCPGDEYAEEYYQNYHYDEEYGDEYNLDSDDGTGV